MAGYQWQRFTVFFWICFEHGWWLVLFLVSVWWKYVYVWFEWRRKTAGYPKQRWCSYYGQNGLSYLRWLCGVFPSVQQRKICFLRWSCRCNTRNKRKIIYGKTAVECRWAFQTLVCLTDTNYRNGGSSMNDTTVKQINFETALVSAVKIPGVKINRDRFLQRELNKGNL